MRRHASVLGLVLVLAATLLVRAPEANASRAEVSAELAPVYDWAYPATEWNCGAFSVCLWDHDWYTGNGLFLSGSFAPCQGFRLEGTPFQDHTYSIWNRASGPFSIWNRYSDGSYRYTRYASLPPGYKHGTAFTHIIDAIVYDPRNDCRTLDLQLVVLARV